MTCNGPQCDAPAVAHGLCSGHYAQAKKLQPLRPLRRMPKTAQVSFRCSQELKDAIQYAAKHAGLSETDWLCKVLKGKLAL